MCTVCITYAKMCKTWSMSDLISYIHTYIHTYIQPSSFRAFFKHFSLLLKTEQKFSFFYYKQLQRNSIPVKSQQNKRNKYKAAARTARNVAAACNARCECFAALQNGERRTKKSLSCCMERSGRAASSGFEKTLKNKRHWIPIFIGMTRENLEKQKKTSYRA